MTDTTDIKALLEKLNAQTNSYDTVIIRDFEAKQLVAAFEAERQRADELKINWDAAKNSIQFYKAEIAALKGDQVPAAYTAPRWLDTRCKLSVWTDRESAALGVGDNSRLIELFTAPQKPVVLPKKAVRNPQFNAGIEACRKAIEAAGGKVEE